MEPSGERVPGVRRIAVLRANALGDLIVALPALDALRATYPDARITLLGRRHAQELLCSRPSAVDDVVVLPPGAIGDDGPAMPAAERAELLERLAREPWDLAIQLHGGGANSNRFLLALGATTTAGSRTPDAPALDRWLSYEHYQWEVARYLEVVGLVGARPVGMEPRLPVVDADRERVARELPDLGRDPFAVLHPGASDPRRRWPVERFAEVGCWLAQRGLRVVITGTSGERSLIERLGAELRPAVSPVAAVDRSLPAMVGLVADAALVVSNDTGPLHLAMAVGTRTVGVYWIGNLINAGPLTRRRHRAIASWRVECPVCGRRTTEDRCPHDVSFVADVESHDVIEAARSLLDDDNPSAPRAV